MINDLFSSELQVINIGLSVFSDNLRTEKVKTVQLDWKPSIFNNAEMAGLLKRYQNLLLKNP
ncbi:MAG: fdrA domain protein [Candidatus Wallbacteria bacterium]|nr:fdrA domain protein [Candidatus Wallbacteria bacterium]